MWDAIEAFREVGGVRIEDNVAVLPSTSGNGGSGKGAPVWNVTMAAGVPKAAREIEEVMAGV